MKEDKVDKFDSSCGSAGGVKNTTCVNIRLDQFFSKNHTSEETTS